MISTNDNKTVRCAIYTRKSTDENLQLDFNSLDAQREAGENYIASQKHTGWVCLTDRYDDGGYSGGTIERPAFQRLMADVEAGKVDCILVYKIDRLSRSLVDFARIMEVLERHNASLVSVTQHFNTTSSMGRLTLNILLSFAQFEREIISERTRDKIAASRRKGKWTGGPPVLGYNRVRDNRGSRLAVNEREADRVRAIFEKYLETGSLLQTVRWLNKRGWTSKRFETFEGKVRGGRVFDKSAVQYLLTNVLYLGKIAYKGQVYDGEHEAIVSEDLFGQVQAQLRMNRNGTSRHTRNKYGAMLKGLVRCKACGCAMVHHFASRGNKRYRYYVCLKAQKQGWDACPSPSLPAPELERFVVDQIRGLGKDDTLLDEVVGGAQARAKEHIKVLGRELEAGRSEAARLNTAIAEVAPRAAVNPKATDELAVLQDELRVAERHVTDINEQIITARQRMLDEDELTGAMEAFDPLWQTLKPGEQARLIRLLVERVEYDGTGETISVTFHPTGIKALAGEEAATCPSN
jgi:site-specific DNA recombinase